MGLHFDTITLLHCNWLFCTILTPALLRSISQHLRVSVPHTLLGLPHLTNIWEPRETS